MNWRAKVRIGDKEVMPFTIPSGIVTTQVSCIENIANSVEEVGVVTTKSVGSRARVMPERDEVEKPIPGKEYGSREPILAQYCDGCYSNNGGLINLGAEEFAKQLSTINFPSDKFLLASIFGRNVDEFAYVARTLEDYVDGFELNLSCPHAKDIGMVLGQDPEIVRKIIRALVGITKKPIFAKLTPNVQNIGEIAIAAMEAGAYGISAINTVGPYEHKINGKYVLSKKIGGMSGKWIKDIGIERNREITEAIGRNVPRIVSGGISNARDVEAYDFVSGKNTVFGIGTALAGMCDDDLKNYFPALIEDLNSNGWTNKAESYLKKANMYYKKVRIDEKIDCADDLKIFKTDRKIEAKPGQFVFAWIPEVGEKPFSIMDDEPLTFGILERGEFTRKINSLGKGDSFYVKGPYGKPVPNIRNSHLVFVGGGCGIAGIYLAAKKLARQNLDTQIFLGAKDKKHIFYYDEFKQHGKVLVATEDGSFGEKGKVSEILEITGFDVDVPGTYFFNCGPRGMVETIVPIEEAVSVSRDRIYSAAEYITSCGIGLCGSCADEKGRRTCVEGPFMNP